MVHPWPGNVRELENVLERAIILSRDELIEKNMLFDSALNVAKESLENLYTDRPTLEKLEERYIKLIMLEVHNKKDEAAEILGGRLRPAEDQGKDRDQRGDRAASADHRNR